MKTILFALALTCLAPLLFAQEALRPPLVSVNGSAVVRVVPDLADLEFQVEIRNADLNVARKQQAERSRKILEALRAAGVAESELQSSQVTITPSYIDRRQETDQIRFYIVSQTICCTVHDVKIVPDLTAAVITAGATGVRDINLRTSQLRKYRDEARGMAIRAAREKATALATELGVKVGKPYTISEGYNYLGNVSAGNSMNNAQAAMDAAPGDGAIPAFAPGSISISANINVSFLIE